MEVIGHIVKDMDAFHTYFADDAPDRELMFFIENHCQQVFKGRLTIIPQAFALPKVGGGTVEAGVLAEIMDITNEEPVLHLVLEAVVTEEKGNLQ